MSASPGSVLLARTDDAGGWAPRTPFPWLAGVPWAHVIHGLPELRRGPRFSFPTAASTEQHTAFYYFLPFLFVLLIVSKAVIAKSHKLGVLKQQRCIVSQLRRPEEQNQDVSRAGSSLGTQRENRSQAPLLASGGCCRSLACGSLTSLPPSARGSRPVCVCVFTELSSLSVCPRAHISLIS